MSNLTSTGSDPQYQGNDEVEVLLAIHASVTAEMNRRHGERYKFHALSFLLLGATGALIGVNSQYVPVEVKAWIFAVAPLSFSIIIGLMLKEHQYINMRDRYIETELRPRLQELVAPSRNFSWLGWEEFEHKQMGRHPGLPRARQRFVVFTILDILDYAIPSLLVATSLVAYVLMRNNITTVYRGWTDCIALFSALIFVIIFVLMLWLRTVEQRWYPVQSTEL